MAPLKKTGMVLGKFLPPTRGHQYLVEFALEYVERLFVVVGTLQSEPIPGELRHAWAREMFPRAEVLHLIDENPQYPHEHPDFWDIWNRSLRRILPAVPDLVFASEDYGRPLADILGAEYVPVDQARRLMPISGTQVREEPMKYWGFIPEPVRPWFVRRVAVAGPESTGKSVLAKRLAAHFHTVFVGEYAWGLIEHSGYEVTPELFPLIARGQTASEDALARQANRVLICDTDLITTTIWADYLAGGCPDWIRREADKREYDLYIIMDADAPWVDDPQRYLRDRRHEFLDRLRSELEKRNRPYVMIGGSYEDRFIGAVRAIEEVLAR